MRVAMTGYYPEDPSRVDGGVAAVTLYLVNELRRIPELDLVVISQERTPSATTRVEDDGMVVHYLPRKPLAGLPRILWYDPRRVRKILAEHRVDLVHVQGSANLANRVPKPRVLTIHGIPELDALYRPRFPRTKSRVQRVIAGHARRNVENTIVISPYVRRLLQKDLRGRTWDIENPVSDSFFDAERRTTPGRVLYGGSICKRKNAAGLLRAFSQVARQREDAELRLAGAGADSPYGRHCAEVSKELGVEDRVQFLGALDMARMRDEMSRAACLALCSFQETAPVVIEEAMATGLPVVASRLCGIPYMVEDGVTGRLVDPKDEDDIARGLLDTLDPDANARMSTAAKGEAEKRFRASVVARKSYEVYREILSRG